MDGSSPSCYGCRLPLGNCAKTCYGQFGIPRTASTGWAEQQMLQDSHHKLGMALDSHHKLGMALDSNHKLGMGLDSHHKLGMALDSHHRLGMPLDSPWHP